MSLGKAKLFSSGLLENDCLGTLRITGVSRTLRVPSPDPPLPLGEVRTQGNRFWFESGDRNRAAVGLDDAELGARGPTEAARKPSTGGTQYSSASMIVITRLVIDGSAGSGEW